MPVLRRYRVIQIFALICFARSFNEATTNRPSIVFQYFIFVAASGEVLPCSSSQARTFRRSRRGLDSGS
jgi:hypothetical protein